MAHADTGSREQILSRVRAAVKQTAPKRSSASTGPIFSPIPDSLERFQTECAANYTEIVLTNDSSATLVALQQVLASLPEGEIFTQDAPKLRDLISRAASDRAVRWSSQGAPADSSKATITLCEALVAMTGSILVSSGCGGRGASVVAPCHIVLAHMGQLVPDLEAALAKAREIAFDHSYVGLISGCSRTADIEKKLIVGAHGPRRVVVILQKEP
jgi:L-lactate dehydrogenase complex protein LldG